VFCCFGLLCRPETLDAVITLLPEQRRERLRPVLDGLSGRPKSELVDQLRTIRQREVAAAYRRNGGERVRWEALPDPLKRWVWERQQGAHEREDHQSPA
jgi:hypothetical protein